MPAKTKKHQEVMDMYLEHDFLEAYAMHTDWRFEQVGFKGAIGEPGQWEEYGELQKNFLLEMGLKPHHQLLDFGCGPGRLARKIVPLLNAGAYTGIDISPKTLETVVKISEIEGWDNKDPLFVQTDCLGVSGPFDYIWSFSVFVHLPESLVRSSFERIADILAPDGKFFFSYVAEEANIRTGLKQFRHMTDVYPKAAEAAGLVVSDLDVKAWKGRQKIALAVRP
jgi:SAM-dependent methyltransferase